MLQIHFSNRLEVLTDQLIARRDGSRVGPFTSDQVVVPSSAMQRSLTLAIARAEGVCAQVAFSYLAPWLWRQTARLLPELQAEAPFVPAVLSWRVHAALGDDAFVAAHPRLAAYLRQADDVMRFDLARRIATLFDHYLGHRPEWPDAWLAGRSTMAGETSGLVRADEAWQAALWRRLAGQAPAPSGAAIVEALKRVTPEAACAAGLPASAHLFALPTLPPLHVAWLQQMGRLTDLHVYVLNPCQEYWFEVMDRRRLAHLAAKGQAQLDLYQEEGNRLLAAWGQQTQALVDGLVDSAGPDSLDDAVFRPAESSTLLARWQNAVLDLRELEAGSIDLADDDRSIEVHVCHSLTRELEVLQDRLLSLVADGTVKHPSEILVVTPDLDAAAPLIEAVFRPAPRERHLPFTISGRARSTVNAPARALLMLLSLLASRFSATAVFALLQQDLVARRFGLDEEGLQQVHDWLRVAGTRWGLDAAHRGGFDVPASARHTWADGLDRLFLGYALPSQAIEPFADLLPAGDAEGTGAAALGAFWQFMSSLRALHDGLSTALAPEAWRDRLLAAVATFMAPEGDQLDDQRELIADIRELTDAMRQAAGGAEAGLALTLPVVRAALEQQLDDPARGGVPTGGVTFSSMSSLRNLPYPVVCVIGLDDGAYPTAQRPAEFDLMARQPRRGDRQRRTDERNLFLDLMLAARRSVYLSYTGRSVRDNAALPPSVLVSELLDVLVPALAMAPSEARRRLVVEHPLQPFSIEGFDVEGDPRLRSHNRELADALRLSLAAAPLAQAPLAQAPSADAARRLAAPAGGNEDDAEDEPVGEPLPPFFARPLPAPEAEWREVSVEQLVEFFRNPCRYLLSRRLGIALARAEDELQDDEPFLPDWPSRTALADRLMAPLMAGADIDTLRRLAEAGPEWPSGALGRQQLEGELESLARFAGQVAEESATPVLPVQAAAFEAVLEGETWRLVGSFADLRPQGLVRWRYDELRPADRLAAWIPHLLLCVESPLGMARRTRWIAADEPLVLGPVEDASERLVELLGLYRRGLREPIEFFPKSAWALVTDSAGAARKKWTPTARTPYAEGSDAAYRLALRGRADALDGEFEALAQAVFGPLQTAAEKEA